MTVFDKIKLWLKFKIGKHPCRTCYFIQAENEHLRKQVKELLEYESSKVDPIQPWMHRDFHAYYNFEGDWKK